MNITVGTNGLRAALRAVGPHLNPDGENSPDLHRVRLEIGAENLTVSATSGFTAGHAVVAIRDHHDGEPGAFDLSPSDVKVILGLFRGSKEGDDLSLRLEVTGKHTTVTDCSGLFDGTQLRLPRYPTTEKFPPVQQLIRDSIVQGVNRRTRDRLHTTPDLVALFVTSAKAYGYPLVIDPAGRKGGTLLITCGEHFIGLLAAREIDEDTTAKLHDWHMRWLDRLEYTEPPAPLIDFDVEPQNLDDPDGGAE